MYLERVEIVGFRGLNRLSLPLDMNTVLVGKMRGVKAHYLMR